jgi:hypothetical protein
MPRLREHVPLPVLDAVTARREKALRRVLRKNRFLWRKEAIGGAMLYSAEAMKDPRSKPNAIREPLLWMTLQSIEILAADIDSRAKATRRREAREDAEDDGRGVGIGIG